jgi:hypothetical protein
MQKLAFLIVTLLLSGCTSTVSYEELALDSTSNFTIPPTGKSGIYVYQWKSGILGASMDVDFEIVGLPEMSLNTGEYGYFEVEPGNYQYKIKGGLFPRYGNATFESGKNYFFRASLYYFNDHAQLVRSQKEINDAKTFISNGKYEIYSAD